MKESDCLKQNINSLNTPSLYLTQKTHELINSNIIDDHESCQETTIATHECLSFQQSIEEVEEVSTDTDLSTRRTRLHENEIIECEINSLGANNNKKSSDHAARYQCNYEINETLCDPA